MERYSVTGMSCAACSARVEKAVSGVIGVEKVSVNLLTNSMTVEGTALPREIILAVEAAGYGASLEGEKRSASDAEEKTLRRRLIASLCLLPFLFYFGMGFMLGLPLPAVFAENPIALALMQMILALALMMINGRFFTKGFRAVLHGAPNMDTLVALGSGVSFLWSFFVFLKMFAAPDSGELLHDLYFESAGMIVTLITVGKTLEARAKGKTTGALTALMNLAPTAAILVKDGVEQEVPAESLKVGDIFAVRPGSAFPADGLVLEGNAAVDESSLTGESIPVDKKPGDEVSTATVNRDGYLLCRATRVGEDTALAKIIRLVRDASSSKAPIARLADRVSAVFVPAVLGIALVTAVIWLLLGEDLGFALARGISVLVISCPCALGLATPVAIMVGSGVGAKNGILFKTALSLEETGRTEIAVLDKTGTLTKGEPEITDILPAPGVSEEKLLSLAAALESRSEHPLAKAVLARAGQPAARELTDFRVFPGNGLSAGLEGKELLGGSLAFYSSRFSLGEEEKALAEQLAGEGKTPLFFAYDSAFLGILAAADALKEDSAEAVRQLKAMGIRPVLLTGDNRKTAEAVAARLEISEVIAGVLPEGKAEALRKLSEEGNTLMVGDGINDGPALSSARVGVAIGAGTDVAIDAADLVLMNSRLTDLTAAIRLSRVTLRNIRENLFWAFFYNVLCIPLAAGCWIPLTGWEMRPAFGALAMSLSSFFVVMNALRLNLCKLYDPSKDRKIRIRKKKSEEKSMQKTLMISGMMCPHCEATVKKALEALEGVASADVSHVKNMAVVTLSGPVEDAALKEAVESHDFKVESIS